LLLCPLLPLKLLRHLLPHHQNLRQHLPLLQFQ
jgi:hypothetical protein